MKKISITHSQNRQREYSICIGSDILKKIGSWYDVRTYSNIFVVTDQNVVPLYLKEAVASFPAGAVSIVLEAGEKEKNIESIQKIWKAMHDAGCDRKSLVVNLGGGVVCDMGGFAASTYMRGVDVLNIPTTLLAQVDASIGGKTGIDFAGIKNLIGTFNQPIGVVIDVHTLATLPQRELVSGFAEIIKHGLIKDEKYFAKVTEKHPLKYNADEMADIITKSCQIKADVVESDETESGTRKILNFGHTIGHAVESLSLHTSAPLLHGEAISIGMLAEAKISHLMDLLSVSDLQRIEKALLAAGLPVSYLDVRVDDVLAKIRSDKKNEKGNIYFTLIRGIGHALYNQNVSEAVIIKAIEHISHI